MITEEIEAWKDIPNYVNYQASSLSRIHQSLSDSNYKYLRTNKTTDEYLTVNVRG